MNAAETIIETTSASMAHMITIVMMGTGFGDMTSTRYILVFMISEVLYHSILARACPTTFDERVFIMLTFAASFEIDLEMPCTQRFDIWYTAGPEAR